MAPNQQRQVISVADPAAMKDGLVDLVNMCHFSIPLGSLGYKLTRREVHRLGLQLRRGLEHCESYVPESPPQHATELPKRSEAHNRVSESAAMGIDHADPDCITRMIAGNLRENAGSRPCV